MGSQITPLNDGQLRSVHTASVHDLCSYCCSSSRLLVGCELAYRLRSFTSGQSQLRWTAVRNVCIKVVIWVWNLDNEWMKTGPQTKYNYFCSPKYVRFCKRWLISQQEKDNLSTYPIIPLSVVQILDENVYRLQVSCAIVGKPAIIVACCMQM